MTMSADVLEGAVPPPPPEVVPESLTIEPAPYARHLWDLVTLHDGLMRADLRNKAQLPLGETFREYARWHNTKVKPDPHVADDEYFERGLQHGIARGWLIVNRGKVTAGTCPPEHRPMKTIGNERTLRANLNKEKERKAYELLINPKSAARQHAVTHKGELRQSLKKVGQLYPILRWHPFGNDPIIIDGVTRYELLRDMGVEEEDIQFKDLGEMTAIEALQLRIEAELNATSKDQRDEARNAYIEGLAMEGFTQKDIAKLVGVSQSRVAQILSATQAGSSRPTEDDVKEFKRLSDAGWNRRAIAEETGWSTGTISRYLSGEATARDPEATVVIRKTRASKKNTPEIMAAAERHGVTPQTINTTGFKKIVATVAAKPDSIDAMLDDDEVGEEFVKRTLYRPEYVEHLIDCLMEVDIAIDLLVKKGIIDRLVERGLVIRT